MTTKIDFANISLQDALDVAIIIEEEAAERYGELAEQLEIHRTPEAATFFRHMVKNEGHHAEKLREQRQKLFGDAASKIDSSMVPEIEAPEYDSVRAFMSEHQALRVAMISEKRAHAFFSSAIEELKDDGILALFNELRDEEAEHQKLVQAEIDKLPPEETTDPNDFADGPVQQ